MWKDLDLDRGVLHVRQALERLGKGWRLVEPKSEQSQRAIKLPDPLLPILRAHRTRQLETRLAAGGRWQDHGFVFTARHGQPLDGCRLNRQTKALLQSAGLPPLHFHSLRHSCATFLLVQGVPPRVVMELLGHSDIRLTLNTYSHVVAQLQDEAARQMSTVLWSGTNA
jgi:integrase